MTDPAEDSTTAAITCDCTMASWALQSCAKSAPSVDKMQPAALIEAIPSMVRAPDCGTTMRLQMPSSRNCSSMDEPTDEFSAVSNTQRCAEWAAASGAWEDRLLQAGVVHQSVEYKDSSELADAWVFAAEDWGAGCMLARCAARICRFRILPLPVRGKLDANATCEGTLYPARVSAQCAKSSWLDTCWPGFTVTAHTTISPRMSLGRPYTTACFTVGCAYSAFSTSTQ